MPVFHHAGHINRSVCGKLFLKRGRAAGVVLPILISVVTVAMMYAGEAAMMDGGLYRFGTGWF